MESYSIDESQRAAARAAGWSYLISSAIVLYANFGVHDRLISESVGNCTSIVAHEQLFRAGLVGDPFYCVGVVIYATAPTALLRPVSRGIALLPAFLRLVWGLMRLAAALRFFDALRLIDSDDNLRRVDPESLRALARAYPDARVDYYYVGLLFGALASIACAYLWFESRYIPRHWQLMASSVIRN